MGATGQLFIGDRGKILTQRANRRFEFQIIPESRRNEYGNPSPRLPRSIGHYNEWLEACKGGKPGGSNFDWAGPLTEAVLLGNVALRLGMREEMTRKKLALGCGVHALHEFRGGQQVSAPRVPRGLDAVITRSNWPRLASTR